MSLTTLKVVSILAAIVAVVFGLWPSLDLAISHAFTVDGTFVAKQIPAFRWFREISMWLPNAIWILSLLALLAKIAWPHRRLLVPGVTALFLLTTTVLAPFLVVNGAFKTFSGRPRPQATVEFGGKYEFKPWWNLTGDCPRNCSFVSGESSHGFWLVAPAALAPAALLPAAYAVAIAYGAVVAALRIAFGGHYFTDVFFGAYITYVLIWLSYHFFFRWPQTRPTDAGVESWLEHAGLAIRARINRLRGATNSAPVSTSGQAQTVPLPEPTKPAE